MIDETFRSPQIVKPIKASESSLAHIGGTGRPPPGFETETFLVGSARSLGSNRQQNCFGEIDNFESRKP
jgi:hypothetical protein